MDRFTIGMIAVFVIVISCTVFTYVNYSSCEDCFVETGLLEKSERIGRIRIDGYEWYIDNLDRWAMEGYYGHDCEVTLMSGCGQTHIKNIKIMQS